MRTHRLLARPATAAVLGALALAPATASADTLLREGDTFSVSAHGGTVAWSQFDARGRGRVYARQDGVNRRLRAPSSEGVVSLDLGARGRSGTRMVFQRCLLRRGCDLYRMDLPDGRARRLRGLSSRRHFEVAPSVWGRTYVFGRIGRGEPQVARSRKGGGLFVKAGRRKLRRITTRVPIDSDVRGRRIAFAHWTASGGSAIYTTTTTSRRLCRVASTGPRRFLRGVAFDGDHVYWLRITTRTGAARIARARIPDRRCRGRGRVEVSSKALPGLAGGEEGAVESLAVDDGAFYYSALGVFAADDPPPFTG